MFLKLYAIALPVFMAVDMVWLGAIAKGFYRAQLGPLLRPDVNWTAAIIFYLLYITGLVLFVIGPSIEKGSWIYALGFGALFGLISYATYDLTNLATLKDWPLVITLVDLAWGAVLGAMVSIITHALYARMFAP